MKRIDSLLIRSFIGPFIATFFIALFVLIMQFLWTYIDDIIGKGAGLWIILELLSYLTISLIPTALPIAVLLSSVMVMGNLAEKYELASIKSAGVPLLRIMQPLLVVVIGISIFSFFCSNNIIPIANLQFKSRLYDIRKQKPTLSLEQGVFNEDFKNFVIHIGKKSPDNKRIEDIIIFDHTTPDQKPTKILADKGEMFTTEDGRYFVMNLYDGTQYQESKQTKKGKDRSYPFVRTSFQTWKKVFDLKEFEIDRTDVNLFDSHHSMLSVSQLRSKIDSIDVKIAVKLDKLSRHTNQYIYIFRPQNDSLIAQDSRIPDSKKEAVGVIDTLRASRVKGSSKKPSKKKLTSNQKKHKQMARERFRKPYAQTINKPLGEYKSIASLFNSQELQQGIYSKAQSYARTVHSQAISTSRTLNKTRESKVKHIYELNIKFSMAFVCVIFLFIGAPMGAIIRKGGFGYPILVAIVFFILFIVLNIFCKKLAESFVLPAVFASWIPCLILFPLGLVLTYRAMNDTKLVDIDRYLVFFRSITRLFGG